MSPTKRYSVGNRMLFLFCAAALWLYALRDVLYKKAHFADMDTAQSLPLPDLLADILGVATAKFVLAFVLFLLVRFLVRRSLRPSGPHHRRWFWLAGILPVLGAGLAMLLAVKSNSRGIGACVMLPFLFAAVFSIMRPARPPGREDGQGPTVTQSVQDQSGAASAGEATSARDVQE